MRERTPSADDTPKRAPPAPLREAASADVAGSKTSNGTLDSFRVSRHPTSSSSPTGTSGTRMVASTHNLDDLSVSHPSSASNERQQQQQLQEKHGHTYRSAQTAQDKRSRLSNVINNLRKKVPDTRNVESPRKEEDGRNSVERNLETLEKYVMTVLNGVIKDEEEDGRDSERKKDTENAKDSRNDEDERHEPNSKGNLEAPPESRTEIAVSITDVDTNLERIEEGEEKRVESLEEDVSQGKDTQKNHENSEESRSLRKNIENTQDISEKMIVEEVQVQSSRKETVEKDDIPRKLEENPEEAMENAQETRSKENASEDHSIIERSLQDEKKEVRSLSTIILERLSEHQSAETNDIKKESSPESLDNSELRTICRDLLNDLLNGINQLIGDDKLETDDSRTSDHVHDESHDSLASHEVSTTSLHCSLPLDKVASVLQNCQSEMTSPRSPSSFSSPSSPSSPTQIVVKSPSKPPSPTVRHLCLYCDRKFLSISLRQRHTERVHQLGGGRRSERNSRKPSQNCQYCSDKCAESLEGLFQHMVGSHADKYHACVQCSTRYLTREALVGHMNETHGSITERTQQCQEKVKDSSLCKDLVQNPREKTEGHTSKERRSDEKEIESRTDLTLLKHGTGAATKDTFSNPGSPEFDSSFYSSVSCNIRENLLHHLDGKLQSCSGSPTTTTTSISDSKQQQLSPQPQQPQQQFYEHNQIQFPIDISLTAATPVYNKEYSSEDYENSSEYAQRPGKKIVSSHPRRVSFEKYNFPRKYDGKEQWTCSIKDLSKFDISTQLSLRKKQQLLKERLNRPNQSSILASCDVNTDVPQTSLECEPQDLDVEKRNGPDSADEPSTFVKDLEDGDQSRSNEKSTAIDRQQNVNDAAAKNQSKYSISTEFSIEFSNFLRLRKWNEAADETAKNQEVIYAELTGEWSRPRVYICGACATRHVTLKEMEDHKASTHPNVWCSHFEFSGDQRELYKHLFLPGRSVATAKAKNAILSEKVCTKCSKNCTTLAELHRHMLECGGDQAWLLGYFGNGKKKCKWRPFGSRSRRRRQRGMKRNIQNSQTPRVNVQKDNTPKQPPGPRVRPSDRESIQKMLANLPPKRATRKVLQDSSIRAQGRLRNVQTRSGPRIANESSSVLRISRNKAVLRNKLLKNAKSIQRNRCRSDNISAVIESVVKSCNEQTKRQESNFDDTKTSEDKKESKETGESSSRNSSNSETSDKRVRRGPKVLGKRKNIKTKDGVVRNFDQIKRRERKGNLKPKGRPPTKNIHVNEDNVNLIDSSSSKTVPKNNKNLKSDTEKSDSSSDGKSWKNKSPTLTTPKKKRPVDPVASLNASIKAKSQLRTQDGKFARNPNKLANEQRPPSNRQLLKPNQINESNDSTVKSKLRTLNKHRNADSQIPRRTTRLLSSDSDKMPTLEPVFQLPSSEDYLEKTSSDLPILSPVTASNNSDQKMNRANKNSPRTIIDESGRAESDFPEKMNQSKVSSQPEEERQQKSTRGRKPKNLENKYRDTNLGGNENSQSSRAESNLSLKDDRTRNRKNIPAKSLNANKLSKSLDDVTRKDIKNKVDETRSFETRSNVKARQERWSDSIEEKIKLQGIPCEVKKLLGAGTKEDLLTKLGLTSREPAAKRTLRQSLPRSKVGEIKNRIPKEAEHENISTHESEVTSDVSKSTLKKSYPRKSPRHVEKKSIEEKEKCLDSKLEEIEKNDPESAKLIKNKNQLDDSNNFPEEENKDQDTKIENQLKIKSTELESTDFNEGTTKRQTRSSLALINTDDVEKKCENPEENNEVSLKRSSSFGRRRGRIKSTLEISDKKNPEIEEELKKSDKIDSLEKEGKTEKIKSLDENVNSDVVNTSLTSLKIETNSSIDSGKENSLETPVVPQRKVGRPRKSWGSKRDKNAKRSLSNVIGILTEGMNIPIQQSVVLTVQTSIENVNTDVPVHNNAQQPVDNNGIPGESNVPPINEKSSESVEENVTVVSSIESDRPIEENQENNVEKIQEPEEIKSEIKKDVQKTENERDVQLTVSSEQMNLSAGQDKPQSVDKSNISSVDKASGVSNLSKARSPTNDIILDLTRRKSKGKGSFLEKIVSKIAKQKDALLEGEVGTLLDSAADELTSILDEVAPNSENGENVNSASKKPSLKTEENKVSTVTEKSVIEAKKESGKIESVHCTEKENLVEKIPVETEKNIDYDISQNLINTQNVINIPKFQIKETRDKDNERIDIPLDQMDECKIGSSNERNENRMEDKIQDLNIESVIDNKEIENAETKVQENPTNCQFIPNGAQLSGSEINSEPMSTSSTIENTSIDKNNIEEITQTDTKIKSKRKSVKRSLETNSPKKNKRKSIQVDEPTEENTIPEEIQLADIMKLIDTPRDSLEKNRDSNSNKNTTSETEKVQTGKRKSICEDHNSSDNVIHENSRVTDNENNEDVSHFSTKTKDGEMPNAKKFKTENLEENKSKLEDDQILEKEQTESKNTEAILLAGKEEEKEEKTSDKMRNLLPTVKRRGKRKSLPESTSKSTELASRRTSKRNSLPEEKRLSSLSTSELQHPKDHIEEPKQSIDNKTDFNISDKSSNLFSETLDKSKIDGESINLISAGSTLTESEIPNVTSGPDTSGHGSIQNSLENVITNIVKNPQPVQIPDVKIPKKRGRKKKCPADPNLSVPNLNDVKQSNSSENIKTIEPSAPAELNQSFKNESAKSNDSQELTATISEPFKIPEVSEVLQHTKKRSSKRKSLIEEHLDLKNLMTPQEINTKSIPSETEKDNRSPEQKIENSEIIQPIKPRGRGRPPKKLNKEKIERSNSSGSINLKTSSRTRFSKRKQHSTDDIMTSISQENAAESTENLSETSCVSESSYFRKKKFSKTKKNVEEHPEEVQTDASITDSESIDTEKNSNIPRRQVPKRKAKKNISLIDEHLDLVGAVDSLSSDFFQFDAIPTPTEFISQKESTISPEESSISENVSTDPTTANDSTKIDTNNSDAKKDELSQETKEETKEITEQENKENDSEKSLVPEEQVDNDNRQLPEEFQTPKKRAAGNFVVVHTKTGEILIVEKRKKLTKEAARFFCDVCSTSFTRKSSLKKHNSSQSHLLLASKSNKEKTGPESNENAPENLEENRDSSLERNENSSQNEFPNERQENLNEKHIDPSVESTENLEENATENITENFESSDVFPRFSVPIESDIPGVDSHVARQEALEDELLDQEICQITENMSQDEYVLTDEINAEQPEASSTPVVKENSTIQENILPKEKTDESKDSKKKKRKTEKKREKKKKNLAEEHLDLDSPEPNLIETSTELINISDPINSSQISSDIPDLSAQTSSEIEKENSQTTQENYSMVNSSITNEVNHLPHDSEKSIPIINSQIEESSVPISKSEENQSLKEETENVKVSEKLKNKGRQSTVENRGSQRKRQDSESGNASVKKLSKSKKNERKEDDVIQSSFETIPNLENNSESQNSFNSRPKRKRQVVGYAEDIDSDIDDVLNESISNFEMRQIDETVPEIKNSTKENTDADLNSEITDLPDDLKDNNFETRTDSISKTGKKRTKRSSKDNENENIEIIRDLDLQNSTETNDVFEQIEVNENQLNRDIDQYKKITTEIINESQEFNDLDDTRSSSKSKKYKKKKISEEFDESESYIQTDHRKSRKSTKHKRDQNKQVLEEIDYSKLSDSSEIIKTPENTEQENVSKEIDQSESVPSIISTENEPDSEYKSKTSTNDINFSENRIESVEEKFEENSEKITAAQNAEKSLFLPNSITIDSILHKSSIFEYEQASKKIEENPAIAFKMPFESLEESNKKSKKLEQVTEQQEIQIASSTDFINEPVINYSIINNQEQIHLSSEDKINQEIISAEDTISKASDFDSDEDSVDTDISADIQKLLDDSEIPEKIEEEPEIPRESIQEEPPKILQDQNPDISYAKISSESELSEVDVSENVFSSNFEESKLVPEEESTERGKLHEESTEIEADQSKQTTIKSEINSSLSAPKKTSKIHKTPNKETHRKRKASRIKKKSKSKIADLGSNSDVSDNEDRIESEDKNKIVKSVFGRVFGGEKADKVKEVLNDWVSKSEDDSDVSRADSSPGKNTKNKKKHSSRSSSAKRNSKGARKNATSSERAKSSASDQEDHPRSASILDHDKSGNNTKVRRKHEEKSNVVYKDLVLPASTCRQSKKRAQELISGAFNDSLLGEDLTTDIADYFKKKYGDYNTFVYEGPASQAQNAESSPKSYTEDQEPKKKSSASKRNKKRNSEELWTDQSPESKQKKSPELDFDNPLIKRIPDKDEEQPLISNVDRAESISSRPESSLAPSSVRNRTPSLDRSSQSTRDSDEDEEERHFDEDRRRLSPLYARGSLESSMDSNSTSDDEEEDVVNEEMPRKRSSSEFSGEKIVIRSPTSSHRDSSRPEVVTIAPTDAIEDNALDVPQEIEPTKPRQGKVLNFDEELFVECCSRLKATTENELRGAKKIKLDHSEAYHRKDEQPQGFRNTRDRWRDVESQNSLGSLLESVNQLLGEEMYSRERDYTKRRNLRSEHSSRSASPDVSRADNVGYEDSLDVAFEHNNKLRDKIQQRMRESENLIATTFGQKTRNDDADHYENHHHHQNRKHDEYQLSDSYHRHDHLSNLSNGEYNDESIVRQDEQPNDSKTHLDPSGFKTKMNSSLGGLLDKALSNLLHSNGKHDHNGSTPMKVLAELACARAPTSTSASYPQGKSLHAKIPSTVKESVHEVNPSILPKDIQVKKTRNPIKELFERKKEMNERKHQERSKAEAALRELNIQKQRKTKKIKKRQDFPLIRRNEYGGLAEKKKRRDGFERKEESATERIKDVYDFDEDESQIEPSLGTGLSYRNKLERNYEVSCLRAKELDIAGIVSKAIGDTLENGKGDALGARLESMIDRKFKEIEKFAPKTKGALKSFQSEERQPQITGPMDEFVERKQRSRKSNEQNNVKQMKLKKRSKNLKKKARNAWYENDSSDEFRTAAKAEDVGVGISKSQRTCSKGKQNLFAELSTSSESEYEENDVEMERHRRGKKTPKKSIEVENEIDRVSIDKFPLANGDEDVDEDVDEWNRRAKDANIKNDCDNKKSESEMSDHPLIIDERKDTDEQRQSDDDVDNQSARGFELDDLYREDSSVADSDLDENTPAENRNTRDDLSQETLVSSQKSICENKVDYSREDELIPLEEALDLLDQPDALRSTSDKTREDLEDVSCVNRIIIPEETELERTDQGEEIEEKCVTPVEEQDEELNDDIPELPEKLSTNEKPQKESENLPLHVFLSRKVQESKKRKQLQLKKLQEEQERILMDFQPTRRQRKCAIGKQGLLAEISSSDEELYAKDTGKRISEKSDHEKQRKQKKELKEKRKERYLEKKHEQIIAKEQKAIEEEILRELGKKKEVLTQNTSDSEVKTTETSEQDITRSSENKLISSHAAQKRKHQQKEKQRKNSKTESIRTEEEYPSDSESNFEKSIGHPSSIDENIISENTKSTEQPAKLKKSSKSPPKARKPKSDFKIANSSKRNRNPNERSKNRSASANGKDSKERKSSSNKRDSDDEELKTTRSWNKVEEGVGVAIGRRKRAAANQLYYWSSSSDEEEVVEPAPVVEEEEDDRQEQHGWIVGDSHKRMITMLAMEKQLKEKRRRSEDEFEPGKTKNKKHRNSTS